jgi:hypothetical protein
MDNNIYIAGYTVEPESEIDTDKFDKQISDAENNYDFYDLYDAFGTNNFENMFRLNYHKILLFQPSDIIVICKMFITKILDIYDYQFIPSLVFADMKDVIEFFDFIKFLEFDNVPFMKELCSELHLSLKDISELKQLSSIGNTKIINQIDNISDHYKYNKLIFDFITTQNKEKIIEWIDTQFINNKPDILLDLV